MSVKWFLALPFCQQIIDLAYIVASHRYANMIPSSELIINPDGTIYHLGLHPEHVHNTVITVGDPNRVDEVAKRLDAIEYMTQHREFKTITGRLGNQALTIISTGIGTDNVDIVFNELDALVNIDFDTRIEKSAKTSLQFIRLGTSGSLRADIPIDSYVASAYAIGLEGLMHFYKYTTSSEEQQIQSMAAEALIGIPGIEPYVSACDASLLQKFSHLCIPGITVTATGFYGPQGRVLRYHLKDTHYLDKLRDIQFNGLRTTNLEMETAGIYGMSNLLGHKAISLNAILANRALGLFSNNPGKIVDGLIDKAFELL